MAEIGDSYGKKYSKVTIINSIKSGTTQEEVREYLERSKKINRIILAIRLMTLFHIGLKEPSIF